jgi:hypothetical protein
MLDCKTTVNSIGILLNIIGVWMVYINSPVNYKSIGGLGFSNTPDDNKNVTDKKNYWLKAGVLIVAAGSALQLISNYIPTSS